MPRAEVAWVNVQIEKRRRKGGTYEVFVLVVAVVTGKTRREVRFAEYADRRDADALAGWLRGRLGLGKGG